MKHNKIYYFNITHYHVTLRNIYNVYNYNKRYRKNNLAIYFLNFLNKLIQ